MADFRKATDSGSYYLSRGQLGILAVGFTVTCSIVFFLGMLVGQGIEEKKLLQRGGDEPITKIPLTAFPGGPSTTKGTSPDQEMTFYDILTKSPTPAPEKASKKKEQGVPKKKVAKAKVTPAPAKPSQRAPVKTPAKRASVSAKRGTTIWSVQVKALTRRGDAQVLTNRLKDKGYKAYLVSIVIKGRTWYRVRVGRLATQKEAKALLERLEKRERFTQAIIAKVTL